MSDNQRREVVVRRIEHIVSAAPPWHADLKDVNLAIASAMRELEELGRRTDYDDALKFEARDDKIVIYYTIEEPG